MKRFILIASIFISFFGLAQDRITGSLYATRSEILAQNGMVATSHPHKHQIS